MNKSFMSQNSKSSIEEAKNLVERSEQSEKPFESARKSAERSEQLEKSLELGRKSVERQEPSEGAFESANISSCERDLSTESLKEDLLALIYGLLDDNQAELLRNRIATDSKIAIIYDEVRDFSEKLEIAAKSPKEESVVVSPHSVKNQSNPFSEGHIDFTSSTMNLPAYIHSNPFISPNDSLLSKHCSSLNDQQNNITDNQSISSQISSVDLERKNKPERKRKVKKSLFLHKKDLQQDSFLQDNESVSSLSPQIDLESRKLKFSISRSALFSPFKNGTAFLFQKIRQRKMENSILISSIILFIFILSGFIGQKLQLQTHLSRDMRVLVAAPSCLSKNTKQIIRVNISDINGKPQTAPVRLVFFDSETQCRLLAHTENTDYRGVLRFEIPPFVSSFSHSIRLEITAGDQNQEMIETLIPVVPSASPKLLALRSPFSSDILPSNTDSLAMKSDITDSPSVTFETSESFQTDQALLNPKAQQKQRLSKQIASEESDQKTRGFPSDLSQITDNDSHSTAEGTDFNDSENVDQNESDSLEKREMSSDSASDVSSFSTIGRTIPDSIHFRSTQAASLAFDNERSRMALSEQSVDSPLLSQSESLELSNEIDSFNDNDKKATDSQNLTGHKILDETSSSDSDFSPSTKRMEAMSGNLSSSSTNHSEKMPGLLGYSPFSNVGPIPESSSESFDSFSNELDNSDSVINELSSEENHSDQRNASDHSNETTDSDDPNNIEESLAENKIKDNIGNDSKNNNPSSGTLNSETQPLKSESDEPLLANEEAILTEEPQPVPAVLPMIHFYPENGLLVAGIENRVWVSSFDSNGHSAQIEGQIKDHQNKIIVDSFSTNQDGLGLFSFVPECFNDYFLEFSDSVTDAKSKIPLGNIESNHPLTFQIPKVFSVREPLRIQFSSFRRSTPIIITVEKNNIIREQLVLQTQEKMSPVVIPLDADLSGTLHINVYNGEKHPYEKLLSTFVYRRPDYSKIVECAVQESEKKLSAVDLNIKNAHNPSSIKNKAVSLSVLIIDSDKKRQLTIDDDLKRSIMSNEDLELLLGTVQNFSSELSPVAKSLNKQNSISNNEPLLFYNLIDLRKKFHKRLFEYQQKENVWIYGLILLGLLGGSAMILTSLMFITLRFSKRRPFILPLCFGFLCFFFCFIMLTDQTTEIMSQSIAFSVNNMKSVKTNSDLLKDSDMLANSADSLTQNSTDQNESLASIHSVNEFKFSPFDNLSPSEEQGILYWNPTLLTDKNGNVSIPIDQQPASEAITIYVIVQEKDGISAFWEQNISINSDVSQVSNEEK